MNETEGYAVFFFPQALEALGDAIKPFLQEGAMGQHVLCQEIDTGGSLIEMTLPVKDSAGNSSACELMVPQSMVRMIVSARSDTVFGFGPHPPPPELVSPLPPVAEPAPPAMAPTKTVPDASVPDATPDP